MSSRGAARQQLLTEHRRTPAARQHAQAQARGAQAHGSLGFLRGAASWPAATEAKSAAAAAAAVAATAAEASGSGGKGANPLRRFQDSLLIQAAWQRGVSNPCG